MNMHTGSSSCLGVDNHEGAARHRHTLELQAHDSDDFASSPMAAEGRHEP